MASPTVPDRRCAQCAAALRPGAPWCSQCYARVGDGGPVASAHVPVPASAPLPPALPAQRSPAPSASAAAPVPSPGAAAPVPSPGTAAPAPSPGTAAWPCSSCGAQNALVEAACGGCGSAFLAGAHDTGPLLVLPVVGDLAALPPARRTAVALALVPALVLVLLLLTLGLGLLLS